MDIVRVMAAVGIVRDTVAAAAGIARAMAAVAADTVRVMAAVAADIVQVAAVVAIVVEGVTAAVVASGKLTRSKSSPGALSGVPGNNHPWDARDPRLWDSRCHLPR